MKVKSGIVMMLIVVLLNCWALSQRNAAVTIVLDETKRELNITSSITILKDNNASINEILSGRYDSQFKKNKNQYVGINVKKKTIWTKFNVQNNGANTNDWLIIVDQKSIDTLILYFKDSTQTYQSVQTGQSELYANRKYKFNTLVLDLPLTGIGIHDYYFKTVSHINNFPIKLVTKAEFNKLSLKRNIIQGIFMGFIIMMLLYNLFIYFFERDKNFILYVLYVLMNGLLVCGYKGYLDLFIPGNQNLIVFSLPAIISLNCLALILFSRNILELPQKFSLANQILLYFFLPLTLLLLALNYISELDWVIIGNLICLFVLLIFVSVLAYFIYRKNFRPALFFVIGSTLFLLGSIVYLCSLYGLFPISGFTNSVLEIGSAMQIMLFSFALGDKIREYKKLKYEMEKELLESLKQNEEIILEQNRMLEFSAAERTKELMLQKDKSDKLLLNILPEDVALELKENGVCEAKLHQNVSVLFTDFVNFTKISEALSPKKLVEKLDLHFKAFDDIIENNGLEKIRTIGDAYLAVCGLRNDDDHANHTVKAALEIRDYLAKQDASDEKFEVRVGIHSGPVVAGIVGDKKFTYDIWGETVNVANKLEQLSDPGKIIISKTTQNLLNGEFSFLPQGVLTVGDNKELEYYFVEHV